MSVQFTTYLQEKPHWERLLLETNTDFMIWRARILFSLLMARLLAVRDFDAIQVSLR
jgi:hypothetical protein